MTGAAGLLGGDLVRLVRATVPGAVVEALGRDRLDVTDARACRRAVSGADVVVNCAAYTAVDAAETDEAAAFAVNGRGAANLARASAAAGARFVQVSTDYVFDGRSTTPYRVQDPTAPASVYGRSKLAGERAAALDPDALVVRTAWLYGAHGPCFPRTMVRLARERGRLRVVEDQVGQPTWTADVARVVRDLVVSGAAGGTYHATSAGRASWWEFARAVLASAGLGEVPVHPVRSGEFPAAAPRPASSVLDAGALVAVGVEPPGPWRERWALAAPVVLGERVVALPRSGDGPVEEVEQVAAVTALAQR